MPEFLDLSCEIKVMVLSHLADSDFSTFLTSQRTCKLFRTIFQDILKVYSKEHGIAIHALLKQHFSPLLDTATATKFDYRKASNVPAPLRGMRWASNINTRAKHLREEASWRNLPLASKTGKIIQNFQILRILRSEFTRRINHIQAHNVEVSKNFDISRGMTIGQFNDFVTIIGSSEDLPFRGKGWKLLLGNRMEDWKEFVEETLYTAFDRTVLDPKIKDLLVKEEGCALWIEFGS